MEIRRRDLMCKKLLLLLLLLMMMMIKEPLREATRGDVVGMKLSRQEE